MFVDFDPWKLTKEHPFFPEGAYNNYTLLEKPEALHYHDFFEIGYCLKGSGLFYVDGKVVPFSGPCCSVIYGGQIHIAQGMFPPGAPSPPFGPPFGTNASRRKLQQPLPPSPALIVISAWSTNMISNFLFQGVRIEKARQMYNYRAISYASGRPERFFSQRSAIMLQPEFPAG